MSMLVKCPNPECSKVSRIPEGNLERTLLCPHCRQKFKAASSAENSLPALSLHTAIRAGAAELSLALNVGLPRQIGRFQVRAHLGEGAFGTVYRAYDPQLDREVALKVPLPGRLDIPQQVERFLREARAAAQLRHPHIVPLFEASGEPPHYYIASAFIQGRTLAAILAEGSLELHHAVEIVRELAEALAYAHDQGIVHRDVKPANVMLDEKGVAHLLDFGLAHSKETQKRLTQEGSIVGTPAYMAPEQVAQSDKILPASDQYALGVLLYELLCGRVPFEGPPEVVLFNALHTEPPPPRQLNSRLPRDLETICLKCLAKEPAKRYCNCAALAEDLERWQRGDPVRARQIAWLERGVRWSRRNPLAAGLAVAFVFTLLLGSSVAMFFAVRANQSAEQARQQAEKAKEAGEREAVKAEQARLAEEQARAKAREADLERQEKQHQLDRAETLAYAGQITLAQREWDHGSPALAWQHLQACQRNLRGWEHRYLSSLFMKNHATLKGHLGWVTSVAFSPDGKRIVSSGGVLQGEVKIWAVDRGSEVLTLQGHTSGVTSVAFSPDGKRIVGGVLQGEVKIWAVDRGSEVLTLQGHTSGMPSVTSVAFSPDGKRFASASWDGTVKVWEAARGNEVFTLKGHTSVVTSVAFSPDGKRIASTSDDGTVKIWDAERGLETLTLEGHSGLVRAVAFSPDGKRIASASWDRTVKVWNVDAGSEIFTLKGHLGFVTSVVFSPDGKQIASGSEDSTVKVWDVNKGRETLTLKGHTGEVTSVAFSPDGKRIVSGSKDSTLKIWEVNKQNNPLTLKGHKDRLLSVALSPDSKRIFSASNDGTVKVWDTDKSSEILSIQESTVPVAISPDGTRIAGGSQDNRVKVWDTKTGRATLTLKGHTGIVSCVAYSPNGKRIASGSWDGTVKVWDADTGSGILTLTGHKSWVMSVAFSPDGKRIVSGSVGGIDGQIRLLPVEVKVWDAETGIDTLTLKGHDGPVESVAFSPDGKRIASASQDGTVKVWDVETGRTTLTLKGHTGWVMSVAFSTDGKRIITGNFDKTVKICNAETGLEILTLKGHFGPVSSVAVSPDGNRIVSGSHDGTIIVWDAGKGP